MSLYTTIKKSFPAQLSISILHCLESWILPKIFSDKKAIIRYYKQKSGGRLPNIEKPLRFSEKLQWYKLNGRLPIMQVCADKYAVRQYLHGLGYDELLNELYDVYENVSDIDLNWLPNQFVLKAAHGSGQNIIVKDKKKVNWFTAKLMMWTWMHQHIAWSGREWVYETMPRRIIAEKFLQDETGELRDYKFFCFNGKPTYMQLEVGRYTSHNTRNFYDMNWNLMPFGKELPHNPDIHVEKPLMFEKMKEIAADLSKPFQFVRVDLYQVNGKIYFGELTFFPAGGAPDFVPDEYDEIVGSHWILKE